MDDRLKQRLIGAIVLVALAVIFIPMILDGGRDKTLPPFGQAIPEKPAVLQELESVEPQVIEKPTSPAIVERQLVDSHTAVIQPEATETEKTESVPSVIAPTKTESDQSKTLLAKKGVKAWVVQVGSFENRKNAQALSDKLRKNKYRAFVEAVKTNGTWNYRVRVGPEVRRGSAESTQKELLAKLKLMAL